MKDKVKAEYNKQISSTRQLVSAASIAINKSEESTKQAFSHALKMNQEHINKHSKMILEISEKLSDALKAIPNSQEIEIKQDSSELLRAIENIAKTSKESAQLIAKSNNDLIEAIKNKPDYTMDVERQGGQITNIKMRAL